MHKPLALTLSQMFDLLISPATRLMGKLHFVQRVVLIGVLTVLTTTVIFTSLYFQLNRDIVNARKELVGIDLIRSATQLMQSLEFHRGISTLSLSNNNESSKSIALNAQLKTSLLLFSLKQKLPFELRSGKRLINIQSEWSLVSEKRMPWNAEHNFEAHNHIISELQNLLIEIADTCGLTQDGYTETYYLIDITVNKFPVAIEHLTQLRGYGSLMLQEKRISLMKKMKISSEVDQFISAQNMLTKSFEMSEVHNSHLKPSIYNVSKDIYLSSQSIINMVKKNILEESFAISPEDFFAKANVSVNKMYDQIYWHILPTTSMLLEERIEQSQKFLLLNMAGATLLFLLFGYMAIGAYLVISRNVKALASAATSFASGNMQKRVHLNTNDELAKIGKCFNEMADSFSDMYQKSFEAEVRVNNIVDTALDAVVQMDGNPPIINCI